MTKYLIFKMSPQILTRLQQVLVFNFTPPALPDWKFVEEPHVINQDVEESDLVSKARGDVEAGWMNCYTVNLLPEPLKIDLN